MQKLEQKSGNCLKIADKSWNYVKMKQNLEYKKKIEKFAKIFLKRTKTPKLLII